MRTSCLLMLLCITACRTVAFHHATPRSNRPASHLSMMGFLGGGGAKIPTSPNDRDNQAIQAVKAAIAKPNNSNFRLLECEFPALASLNKLGDGSLQSSNAVDDSNLATAVKLCNALSVPVFGPTACLLTSASATGRLLQRARKAYRTVHSLRDGVPDTSKNNNLFVLVAPSGRDYAVAQQLAADGATVVLVNGFAKDNKSVPAEATMAYFVKPLTYNSQVAGYLVRAYPSPWTTIDATTRAVLGTATDGQILVRDTNTPDLRAAVKLVQTAVDVRAMAARQK